MDKKEQLVKLLSGDLELQEKVSILEEIKHDDSLKEEYEKLKNIWALSTSNQSMDELDVERSYSSFKKIQGNRTKVIVLNVLKYVAIVVLFFSLGIVSNRFIPKDLLRLSLDENAYNEIRVPNGEKAELTLSDGSKVWLNSGTTFEFPKSFDDECRSVKLSGEAYFEVQKGKIPFIVSSAYGDIKVLGTKFNVQAYDDLNFQATLAEGKINFKNPIGERTLAPGQQLTLTDDQKLIVKDVDPEVAYSWKKGIISFEKEPLGEVMKKLERHFDIHIVLDQQLAQIRFTGEVFNESVNEVVEYINKTKPINYTYDKKRKILKITSRTETKKNRKAGCARSCPLNNLIDIKLITKNVKL